MNQGLTIWDASGQVTFDSNTRRPRVFQFYNNLTHGGSASIPLPGTPFAICHPTRPISESNLYYSPMGLAVGAYRAGTTMHFVTLGGARWSGYAGVM